jgi:NADH dehydrogenase [ubiquinone] 1 alpha subcomplex assembly factor 2
MAYVDPQAAQWMQWLRHTRTEPPSINEQQLDEIRQAQMKQLAAAADARWASKPSFLDAPLKQQPSIGSMLKASQTESGAATQPVVVQNIGISGTKATVKTMDGEEPETRKKGNTEPPSPWKGVKFGKEGEPQPESWTPKSAKRR